jgi:hypothetical protein
MDRASPAGTGNLADAATSTGLALEENVAAARISLSADDLARLAT